MEKLLVFADFDWIGSPKLIGTLGYEFLRGSDSYSFEFDRDWLAKYNGISISADLNNYQGRQFTVPGAQIFACFSDAMPDRWGRTLLKRREQLLAQAEHRAVRKLSSFEMLTGIDDLSRMGGLRFKRESEGDFINSDPILRVPPITDLRKLLAAAKEIERCELKNELPEDKWLAQLIHPGTSLGGARPKACVADEHGILYVAKFPSCNDDYDIALWEHHSHLLAQKAGINVAVTKALKTDARYHTLLSTRFDRTDDGRRKHFASAMTMLGLNDGSNAQSGNGYLDIVDFIIQGCCEVEANLKELYRRVAFSICIGNSDDHFRNHGFLLTKRGWILSPAYDLNPTLSPYQSLLINADTNEADLGVLLGSCKDYYLSKKQAQQIIDEVLAGVSHWQELAIKLGIAPREIEMFTPVYERCLKC